MLSARDSAVVVQAWDGVIRGMQALTPAARHLYELAVRQVVVESVTVFVVIGLLWLIPVSLYRVAVKHPTEKYSEQEAAEQWLVAAYVTGSLLLVVTCIVLCNTLPSLLNPEFAAIRNLAAMVKGGGS